MKKLQLSQLIKAVLAFALISTVTVDAWLMLADNLEILRVHPEWYWNGPVLVWALLGIPVSIALAERIISSAYDKRARIRTVTESRLRPLRPIPLTRNGKVGTLLTYTVGGIFGNVQEEVEVSWIVPVGDERITISEQELTDFLEIAVRRSAHPFSRRYWTVTRRLPRARYDALMSLLTAAGLIANRSAGASGHLAGNLNPRQAIKYLKYESEYKL